MSAAMLGPRKFDAKSTVVSAARVYVLSNKYVPDGL